VNDELFEHQMLVTAMLIIDGSEEVTGAVALAR